MSHNDSAERNLFALCDIQHYATNKLGTRLTSVGIGVESYMIWKIVISIPHKKLYFELKNAFMDFVMR